MNNEEYKIKGWVARDKFGLWLYRETPYKEEGFFCSYWISKNDPNELFCLDDNLFPDLSFDDEPIEVELTIKKYD